MKDLIVILVTLAFFAICLAYVAWCDRILGPDDDLAVSGGTSADASSTPVVDPVTS